MQAWGTNWALVSILVLLDFVLKVDTRMTHAAAFNDEFQSLFYWILFLRTFGATL